MMSWPTEMFAMDPMVTWVVPTVAVAAARFASEPFETLNTSHTDGPADIVLKVAAGEFVMVGVQAVERVTTPVVVLIVLIKKNVVRAGPFVMAPDAHTSTSPGRTLDRPVPERVRVDPLPASDPLEMMVDTVGALVVPMYSVSSARTDDACPPRTNTLPVSCGRTIPSELKTIVGLQVTFTFEQLEVKFQRAFRLVGDSGVLKTHVSALTG